MCCIAAVLSICSGFNNLEKTNLLHIEANNLKHSSCNHFLRSLYTESKGALLSTTSILQRKVKKKKEKKKKTTFDSKRNPRKGERAGKRRQGKQSYGKSLTRVLQKQMWNCEGRIFLPFSL